MGTHSAELVREEGLERVRGNRDATHPGRPAVLVRRGEHKSGDCQDERQRKTSVANGDREVRRPATDHAVHDAADAQRESAIFSGAPEDGGVTIDPYTMSVTVAQCQRWKPDPRTA
jgi:hypothetical protein